VVARVRCTGGSSLGSRISEATLPFSPRSQREGDRRFDRPVPRPPSRRVAPFGRPGSNRMSAGPAPAVTLQAPAFSRSGG
jgi:hypothetical protein